MPTFHITLQSRDTNEGHEPRNVKSYSVTAETAQEAEPESKRRFFEEFGEAGLILSTHVGETTQVTGLHRVHHLPNEAGDDSYV